MRRVFVIVGLFLALALVAIVLIYTPRVIGAITAGAAGIAFGWNFDRIHAELARKK